MRAEYGLPEGADGIPERSVTRFLSVAGVMLKSN